MRLPRAIALLVALCAGAQAAPSRLTAPRLSSIAADSAIYLGPSGAMLEADYFRAPRPRYGASRIFPCRLHLRIAESTRRIVQSCD
jgi:hypothetical protein